jgi:hypothetical protein
MVWSAVLPSGVAACLACALHMSWGMFCMRTRHTKLLTEVPANQEFGFQIGVYMTAATLIYKYSTVTLYMHYDGQYSSSE